MLRVETSPPCKNAAAAPLFAAGKRSQAEIARELDIIRQSVSRWFVAWRQDNPNWIRGAGRAGRRPQLGKAQLKQVDKALRQGAYPGEEDGIRGCRCAIWQGESIWETADYLPGSCRRYIGKGARPVPRRWCHRPL